MGGAVLRVVTVVLGAMFLALAISGTVVAEDKTADRTLAEQQASCPSTHPVDCDDYCCESGSACCGNQTCCPTGFPHLCGGSCYRTLQDAVNAGCSRNEVVVCGVGQ